MTTDSIYELQNIDCNCNDCKFMVRDFERFNKSLEFHKSIQLNDWQRNSELLKKQGLKVKPFQFDKSQVIINYGTCTKFNKSVSFIPNTCQLHTQECFVHRKDI